MMALTLPARLKGYRFPRSVIAYAVWSYYRFNLSLRDVEDLLAARGVIVCYATIRVWVDRFGPQIAAQIRRDRLPAGDKWHLDEMVITISRVRGHEADVRKVCLFSDGFSIRNRGVCLSGGVGLRRLDDGEQLLWL